MSSTYTQSLHIEPDLNILPPSEIRHYLRIDTQDEDELLLMLSRTAATHVEQDEDELLLMLSRTALRT